MLVHRVEAGEELAGSARVRWRWPATGRWPSRPSSGRPPSPRSRASSEVSMPNASTSSALVETATKWCRTGSSPALAASPPSSQSRALRALVSVSSVVKVFEQTTNRVERGRGRRTASSTSTPSMFDTKRTSMAGSARSRSARQAIAGPRSEPPMPMFTTARMRSPVAPVQAPERTRSANPDMRSSTACTSGTTLWPSTSITASRGARSATCSAGRPSVTLIRSPANIASMRRGSPARLRPAPRAGRASRG